MGQVELTGSLAFGPSGGDCAFPSSQDTMSLATSPSPKPAQAMTGSMQRLLISPAAFVMLSGIGATDNVQRCDTLYFRADAPMKLRLTFADPAGGADIVSVINVQGSYFMETPPNGYIKTVEAQGSARIEYAASGLS